MSYAPLSTYVAPARRRSALWRTVLGLLLIFAVYAAILAAVAVVLFRLAGEGRFQPLAADIALGETPWGMIALLWSFAALAIGPMIAVRLLHGRSIRSLFGRGGTVLRDFVKAAATLIVIYVLGITVTSLLPGEEGTLPGLDLRRWLTFLPLALIGIGIQTLAEELVFRGYLLQQLAARFRSPLIYLLLPSILFALLHYEPGLMGPNAIYVVAATGLFGLVAADLTARTGSIGAAWGLHFANNAAALLFVSSGGALQGLALRISTVAPETEGFVAMIVIDAVMLAIVWGLCRLVLRR
ncbi:CPBP family intramembrane glutamic endopeptidase [Haematobacter genomosp. 1]|nr:CPBP family intramembrane glutamic endopeptidase [Haematobacter genomosp. 1]